MAQQPLGVLGHIRGERKRREAAECGHVAWVRAQDLAENSLGFAAVAGGERGGSFLDARAVRIGEPRALERRGSIGELAELDQHIAVGEPRPMMVRLALQDPPHLRARLRRVPGAAVSAGKIDARLGELRRRAEYPLERLARRGRPVLREEHRTQQPLAVDFTRPLGRERAQCDFRARRLASAQRRVRAAQALIECGGSARRVHGSQR